MGCILALMGSFIGWGTGAWGHWSRTQAARRAAYRIEQRWYTTQTAFWGARRDESLAVRWCLFSPSDKGNCHHAGSHVRVLTPRSTQTTLLTEPPAQVIWQGFWQAHAPPERGIQWTVHAVKNGRWLWQATPTSPACVLWVSNRLGRLRPPRRTENGLRACLEAKGP